jgi:NAD(P)-dependent dehydrogenase (short-subunit alcohol dehydrogenase family)
MPKLDGKVAIVTGAGRGIGREHSLALARAGARVVVNDLGVSLAGEAAGDSPGAQVVDEIRDAGGEAVANAENVADFAGAKRLVEQAVETFGRLDILVNNAGILRDRMLVNMEEGEWDAVIAVHLKGHFAPTHHAAAYWRDRSKAGDEVRARAQARAAHRIRSRVGRSACTQPVGSVVAAAAFQLWPWSASLLGKEVSRVAGPENRAAPFLCRHAFISVQGAAQTCNTALTADRHLAGRKCRGLRIRCDAAPSASAASARTPGESGVGALDHPLGAAEILRHLPTGIRW